MSVANKLRAVLNLTDSKPADLSECLNKSVQSVRNKFSQDAFSISDVLKICDYLGCELQIKTGDGQTIALTIDDVKDSEKPSDNKAGAQSQGEA